ncbi:MAG: hypothetical protein K2X98_02995 [Alphaproteobacteria bacterium]|nr:hypothetical protein [Alphaproteobacteria bacterium]
MFIFLFIFFLFSSLYAMDSAKDSTPLEEEIHRVVISKTLFDTRPPTSPFYIIDKEYDSKKSNGYTSDEGTLPIESDEDEHGTPPNSPLSLSYNPYFNEKTLSSNKAHVILHDNMTIASFSDLGELFSQTNNMTKAIDFDDTIARNISTVDGKHSFPLAGTADYLRTYSEYFTEALNALGRTDPHYKEKTLEDVTNAWEKLELSGRVTQNYQILDKSLHDTLITHTKNIAYITVLSGFPNTFHKNSLLLNIGIYRYLSPDRSLGEDKAEVLAKDIPPHSTTIIFTDNSLQYAINPFRKKIVAALEKYFIPKEDNQTVNVYTVHHTQFENELKVPDALMNELRLLFDLVEKTEQ